MVRKVSTGSASGSNMIEPLDRTGKWRTFPTADGRAGDPKRQYPFPSTDGEDVPLSEYERRCILSVLESTNWRTKGARGAATLLGVPPSTLYGKMKKLGIRSQRG